MNCSLALPIGNALRMHSPIVVFPIIAIIIHSIYNFSAGHRHCYDNEMCACGIINSFNRNEVFSLRDEWHRWWLLRKDFSKLCKYIIHGIRFGPAKSFVTQTASGAILGKFFVNFICMALSAMEESLQPNTVTPSSVSQKIRASIQFNIVN